MTTQDEAYLGGKLSGYLETERLRQASRYIQPGHHVLDLACNEGRLIDFLPDGAAYTGIDINDRALARARQLYPGREFLNADLSQTLPDSLYGQFDVIVMLAFLEHIPQPADMLRVVAGALKSDGRIVITTPAPWGRQVHDMGAKLGLFSRQAAEEHETFLGRRTLDDIARGAGLRMSEFRYFLFGFNQLAIFQHPQAR
jgi:SAM-dependent methyltransferase